MIVAYCFDTEAFDIYLTSPLVEGRHMIYFINSINDCDFIHVLISVAVITVQITFGLAEQLF